MAYTGQPEDQHRFRKGRSYLSNFITFCDKVTHLLDEGRAIDVFYLGSVRPLKPFPTAFSWKDLAPPVLDRCTLCWVNNCLDGQARKWWGMHLNEISIQSAVMLPRSQHWVQSYLISLSDQNEGIECTVSKFADDTKLICWRALQRDLDSLD